LTHSFKELRIWACSGFRDGCRLSLPASERLFTVMVALYVSVIVRQGGPNCYPTPFPSAHTFRILDLVGHHLRPNVGPHESTILLPFNRPTCCMAAYEPPRLVRGSPFNSTTLACTHISLLVDRTSIRYQFMSPTPAEIPRPLNSSSKFCSQSRRRIPRLFFLTEKMSEPWVSNEEGED
jgi:hypothetical protein